MSAENRVVDLMEALEKSVAEAKAARRKSRADREQFLDARYEWEQEQTAEERGRG